MDNKKKNFFMPFGYFGNLWRTIIFLCGFLLLCFLYKLLPSVPPVSPIEKGLKMDAAADSAYNATPLRSDSPETIDSTCYDLTRFCPTPGDQGDFGTCVAWSSGYAARTICEAVDSNWTDTPKITSEAFAPWFIFTNIKDAYDMYCEDGAYISDAMELMKTKGIPKKSAYDVECNSAVPPEIFPLGEKYKIDDYFRLFHIYSYDAVEDSLKIIRCKRALINNRPIVIGMRCYRSFSYADDVWDGDTSVYRGGHAMCVVGFCDNKYGGAFLIQNSWGPNWGNGGRTWVRYDDFVRQTKYAYEIYMKPHYPDSLNHFAGALTLLKKSGEPFAIDQDSTQTVRHYTVTENIETDMPTTDTLKFHIKLENKEPAYVYLIGGNNNGKQLLFPYDRTISPALVYRPNNVVMLPNDDDGFFIESTVKDYYLCLLCSPDPIDINQLGNDIDNETGSFKEKVTKALSTRMVAGYDIQYSKDKINFTSKTRGEILPIFVKLN